MRRALCCLVLLAACSDDDDTPPATETGCDDGTTVCQGNSIARCSGGELVAETMCAEGCVEDATGARCAETMAECDDGELRCNEAALERCDGGSWTLETDCAAAGEVCTPAEPACVGGGWIHVPVTIDDPIVNGTSLVVPIDAVSYAHDGGAFITAFGRDINDPNVTFLWHLDETTGTHTKQLLGGTAFDAATNFCANEQWCQLIGFDAANDRWVIAAPAAPSMMRVTRGYDASLVPVSGSQPPASYVNHSHRFAWPRLFLYGATGPSSFSDTVSALNLDTGVWSEPATGLPEVDDNCIAVDPDDDVLYSLGGRLTTDGGNSTETLDTYLVIELDDGSHTSADLPPAMGARSNMACAFDATRGLLYAFGGALVIDRFDEAQNTYHNDLWALDVASGTWTEILGDTEPGTLGAPDAYGDRAFTGHPEGPNFGQNRGYLEHDAGADRLTIIGAVPIFTHEQLYVLPLAGLVE